ncbi:MAG: phage baseplate assembly protein V [Acetivibrio sp.]
MALFDELLEVSNKTYHDKMFSITTGYVKENYNDKFPGKVKVEFFLAEKGKSVTEWIRVMSSYSGNGYGNFFLPEVGTEVVVGFNMGDINEPIVMGCLWNDKDKLPQKTVDKGNEIKKIRTKGGHEILFDERKDKEKISIHTIANMTIELEDKKKLITIKDASSDNVLEIDGKNGEISIKAKKKLSLNVGGKDMLVLDNTTKTVKIAADMVKIEGKQTLKLKGQNTSLEGSIVKLKAQGTLKAESSGIFQAKGSLVKIN